MSKQEITQSNKEAVAKSELPFVEQSKNVYRLNTERGAVVFYAESGKWLHRGRSFQGFLSLVVWLKEEKLV